MPLARWKNQSGAFDLPSILVGVVVVGILTAGVFAAIFGVIPWSQDRAAKQDLAAVNTAQGVSYAKDGGFQSKAGLVDAGLLGSELPGELNIRATADGECYVAVGISGTGDRFIISSDETSARELAPDDTWCGGEPIAPGAETTPEPPTVEPEPEAVMVSTWNTNLASRCKTIDLPISDFKGTVDWGDGTTDSKTSHTYSKTGVVTIRINGTFTEWGDKALSTAPALCIVSVDQWGETGTTMLAGAFYESKNLKHVERIPSTTTYLRYAFHGVTSDFTIGDFDTSNVTDMYGMFHDAERFNRPVNFDTSNVTNMRMMFDGAEAFNQPVNFTDTSKVTNMNRMFLEAPAFNQPLNFDTSNVTDMAAMFYGAKTFNQDLSAWNVSKVTDHTIFSSGSNWKLPKPNWVS